MIDVINIFVFSSLIMAIHALSAPKHAYYGNILASTAVIIAVFFYLKNIPCIYLPAVVITVLLGSVAGIITARKINMPNLPQIIALFNGFGGLASGLIGLSEILISEHTSFLLICLAGFGFITLGGSVAAFIKLSGFHLSLPANILKLANSALFLISVTLGTFIAITPSAVILSGYVILICLWGFLFTTRIGGADMPIIISLLNALSGWCGVLAGFNGQNNLLIITGSLIGASGLILTYLMTISMNRHLKQIIFSTPPDTHHKTSATEKHVNRGTPKDAAFLMENATKIIIIPGYGMAVSGAQYELASLAKLLQNKYHATVKFAIHPVAGRMPGHMNVLLAEADIPPENIVEMKNINPEFQTADIAYIIGANDITNPLAKTATDSPIYQMPILEAEQARHILFVKRSLAPGYANLDNPLFYNPKTIMLFGDAKEVTRQIITDLE